MIHYRTGCGRGLAAHTLSGTLRTNQVADAHFEEAGRRVANTMAGVALLQFVGAGAFWLAWIMGWLGATPSDSPLVMAVMIGAVAVGVIYGVLCFLAKAARDAYRLQKGDVDRRAAHGLAGVGRL